MFIASIDKLKLNATSEAVVLEDIIKANSLTN